MPNPATNLLKTLTDASEGTRKEGFTIGGVTGTLNGAQDTMTFTVTIPVTIQTDATTESMVIAAQDFLELPDYVTP